MEISQTLMDKLGKEQEMLKIINALALADVEVERVNDYGTLAYMIRGGALEGRFVTIKVVLTKEYDEDDMKGFDIDEAMLEYQLRVQKDNEKLEKNKAKLEKDRLKQEKINKVKVNS